MPGFPTSRFRAVLPKLGTPAIALLIFLICLLRAQPAFFRGTYATEGGAWLSQIWQIGFPEALQTIRPDYCVLGNLVVIKAADALTTLTSGSPLGAMGPFWQHGFAALYVALNFLLCYTILRRHHGWGGALLVTIVMLLAPDADDENRIFGEANNVGFFSVLSVVFIYYDFWLSRSVSWKRMAVHLGLVIFHILTSPLAGIVAAAFSGLLIARLGWSVWKKEAAFRAILGRSAAWSLPALLAILTILRARHHGPSATMAAESAAGGLSSLKPFLIDYVLCRQWLYPFTLNFYLSASDGLTLAVFAAVLAGLGFWLWSEKRRSQDPHGGSKVTGLLLLSAVSLAVAFVTVYSRRWLVGKGLHYESLWPARYYLVQTMIMAGFFTMVLLRCGDLWPRFRSASRVIPLLMGLNFAVMQYPHLEKVLTNPSPAVDARRWSAQLGRVRSLATLTGDLPGAVSQKIPALLDVEMYIEGHAVPVPAALMAAPARDKTAKNPDVCPAALTTPEPLRQAAPGCPRRLDVSDLRLIPRHGGMLLMADLLLPQSPNLSTKRRQVWLGSLPGQPIVQVWNYSSAEPVDLSKPRKNRRELKNWLFKVALWWDHPPDMKELQAALQDLPLAVGESPGQPTACGVLVPRGATVPVTAMRDDATCALLLHPQPPALTWEWKAASLTGKNVTLSPEAILVPDASPDTFDEATYLRLNPDVQRALDLKAISSGLAHYQAFGKQENRPSALRSVTLDIAEAGLASDQLSGLKVELDRMRREVPQRLRVVCTGPGGQEAAFTLTPPEGRTDCEVNFLPTTWSGPPFPLQRIGLQFEDAVDDSSFRILRITLTKRA